MARPFDIAREDEVFDNAEAGEIDVNDVVEETTVVEEESEGNAEIDKQVEALAETAEEADELITEQGNNEQKLETEEPAAGDEASDSITEDDVVVSEENLKYHMIRLGYDEGLGDRISFAKEAKTSPLSPRERLRISNEAVGDFIAKVISNIKTLINKIVISCKKLFAKVLFKFGRYEKKIKALKERLDDIKSIKLTSLNSDDLKEYAEKLGKVAPVLFIGGEAKEVSNDKNSTHIMQIYENASKTFINDLIKDTKDENKKADKKGILDKIMAKFKLIGKTTLNEKIKKYSDAGAPPADFDGATVISIIGKKIYYMPSKLEGKLVKSYDLWEGDAPKNALYKELAKAAVDKNSIMDDLNKGLSLVKNAKQVFSAFDKNEETYLKYLKELESKIKAKDSVSNKALKVGLDVLRVGAAEINLICVRGFISLIKQLVAGSAIIISALEDADQGE